MFILKLFRLILNTNFAMIISVLTDNKPEEKPAKLLVEDLLKNELTTGTNACDH